MKRFAIKFNKHRRRKNNDQVNVWYELYLDGRSVPQIAAMFHKGVNTIYSVFRTRGYKPIKRQLKGLTIIDGTTFSEEGHEYLRGTRDGKRVLAHHFVWEKHHGPRPSDSVISFIDGNRRNVAIDNLRLVKIVDMANTFNPTHSRQLAHNP